MTAKRINIIAQLHLIALIVFKKCQRKRAKFRLFFYIYEYRMCKKNAIIRKLHSFIPV